MNEPAHLIPEDGPAMTTWLAKAVDIFRQRIVGVYAMDHPLLFVNLISTSISDQGRFVNITVDIIKICRPRLLRISHSSHSSLNGL